MHQILITCREAAIAAIPLTPIFFGLNHYLIHSKTRTILYWTFAVYICAMYAAVGLPDITYCRYSPRFNFTPFMYMFSAWETTALNVLLFIPLGWFLPVLWRKYKSPIKTICLGLSISIAVEFLQIFTYRATDINDLITNTFGTILGYLCAVITLKIFAEWEPSENYKDLFLIFGISFLVMFFLYPFLCMSQQ